MRVVIIGGSGHVGTYLVPRLVAAGHEVVAVSRGRRDPYQAHRAWAAVEQHTIDRAAAEASGTFGAQIRELRPDVVIDMICFTLDSARQLVEALARHRAALPALRHDLGARSQRRSCRRPKTQPRRPFGEYGIQKAAIEAYLLDEARRAGFPATVLHPGHIVGPGWAPLNPAGHFNPGVFTQLARGEELALPNLGLETVHHVHADDVAQAFDAGARALEQPPWARAFTWCRPRRSRCAAMPRRSQGGSGSRRGCDSCRGRSGARRSRRRRRSATWDHIAHSPNCSIAKAERLLEYRPRYTSLQAVHEAVQWLIQDGQVRLPER